MFRNKHLMIFSSNKSSKNNCNLMVRFRRFGLKHFITTVNLMQSVLSFVIVGRGEWL